MKVSIVFQHSNGIGHLTRCSALASAFSSVGTVTLFSGGPPVAHTPPPPGVHFVQLPPTRWEKVASARAVPLDPSQDPRTIDALRSRVLLDHHARQPPDVVIIEYYPFAPCRFGATLDDWFRVIRTVPVRPLLVCSIRAYPRLRFLDADVDPQWVNRRLREDFACVLHHADPALMPIASLGPYITTALQDVPVVQTGFVRRPLSPARRGERRGLLLTVGGGGQQGAALIRRWIEAARQGPPGLWPLTVVCGPLMTAEDRALLHRERADDLVVLDAVPSLDGLLQQVRAVVCLGGYNTLVESLSLGLPVLAFPNGPGEDQLFQVRALAQQGMLIAGDMSMPVARITTLMEDLLDFRPGRAIDTDGARRSLAVVQSLLARQHPLS